MPRRTYALLSAVAIVAGGFALLPAARPVPGHALFHINCPPGSHVARSSQTFGPKLQHARETALAARSITSGHP